MHSHGFAEAYASWGYAGDLSRDGAEMLLYMGGRFPNTRVDCEGFCLLSGPTLLQTLACILMCVGCSRNQLGLVGSSSVNLISKGAPWEVDTPTEHFYMKS